MSQDELNKSKVPDPEVVPRAKRRRFSAEYWLQASDPAVVAIFGADSVAPIMAIATEWGDVFDITVVPAVTAEEGLQLAQQMMQG